MHFSKKLLIYSLFFTLISCFDENEYYYQSKAEAVEQGAIDRKTIPNFIPDSSVKITNRIFEDGQINGEFYFCLLYTSPSPRDA